MRGKTKLINIFVFQQLCKRNLYGENNVDVTKVIILLLFNLKKNVHMFFKHYIKQFIENIILMSFHNDSHQC